MHMVSVKYIEWLVAIDRLTGGFYPNGWLAGLGWLTLRLGWSMLLPASPYFPSNSLHLVPFPPLHLFYYPKQHGISLL